ncbi:MAG: homoserine O-acetyltransferase [Kiritimatiellia bacterium]|nr:homoserine O-acetyltransferase [Kiritimatiellia bacterium]
MTNGFSDKGSVGLVETKYLRLALPPEGFKLENGGALPELQAAYETYGRLSPTADNVVYVCHALTGDAHVAGYHTAKDIKPGWWDAMIGPGKGIDTNRFYVICANILGGCMGTTGPASIDPRTGKPYGSSFPPITIPDIVNAQELLLRQLGIRRLAAVVGGSLGGMQVLEWSIRFPQMVEKCVCIASGMNLSAQALAFDIVGRNAIITDPAWANGDYYQNERKPAQGLAQARMIGHITYLSSENMKFKFGREKKEILDPLPRFATPFQIESYLDYQSEKFVHRFDANSYLHITEAMDVFDLTENVAEPADAFRNVDPKTRFLVVALSSDWLFPPEQSLQLATTLIRAGKRVSYCLLHSPYGHDAFLVEIDHLAEVMRSFLESPDRPALMLRNEPTPARLQRYPAHSRYAPALRAGAQSAAADGQAAQISKRAGAPLPRRENTDKKNTGPADDFTFITERIKPKTRVLDLGCGDGRLLCELFAFKNISGLGMDIDLENIIAVIRNGLDVFQCDLDAGLSSIPDKTYDCAILSQTLQVVRKPRQLLNEMLRVARMGFVSFPNFGNWRHRLRLGLTGKMPVSDSLPFEWYDTPNIHLSTLRDFRALCARDHIRITEEICIPRKFPDRVLIKIGWRNLGADRILLGISRNN